MEVPQGPHVGDSTLARVPVNENTMSDDKGMEAMFNRFVKKVDEDRQLVIAEMQTVMVIKLKDEIVSSVNKSLQDSLASMKNELYTDLKDKFSGELNDIRSEIDELRLSSDGKPVNDDKITEIMNRLDNFENPTNNTVASQLFNEFEERIKRKKNVIVLNIPENEGCDANSRIADDNQSICSIINELSVDIDTSIIKCFRLGKFSRNLVHPRPIKVLCFDADKAHDFIVKGTRMS